MISKQNGHMEAPDGIVYLCWIMRHAIHGDYNVTASAMIYACWKATP